MPLNIPRESKEYLKTTVTSDISPGGTPRFAFTPLGQRPTNWVTGAWNAAASLLTDGTFERVARTPLIGDTGGIVLAPGVYEAWIEVQDAPEIPVQLFDTLTVG